ncbi:thiol-disulfide isomerase, partial [Candidatus Sumerlaeota bacterium]|nr:thiol-disulfide isomerase [Candidatus Sumerlaeota bacterium]
MCCLIGYAALARAEGGPTYDREISRIFQKHCQECHRPGEIAPMTLMGYEEARPWAKSIKKEVVAR